MQTVSIKSDGMLYNTGIKRQVSMIDLLLVWLGFFAWLHIKPILKTIDSRAYADITTTPCNNKCRSRAPVYILKDLEAYVAIKEQYVKAYLALNIYLP